MTSPHPLQKQNPKRAPFGQELTRCQQSASTRRLSEIIDDRRCCPEITLAPNHKGRIVECSSQIVCARANGHGICRPVVNSASGCPGIASGPSPEQDCAVIRKDRTTHFGAPEEYVNVRIKPTVQRVMENGTREVSKDRTIPPRTQYIGGLGITHISR
jgi:hypothetical protein